MNLRIFYISLLTLLLPLCSQANGSLVFPYKFQIKVKTGHKHFGPKNHITGLDQNRNYTDIDKDGFIDLIDPDIDGDGALNYLDIAPLNKKKQGKDIDNDGIPDFVDFLVNGKLKERMNLESAALQQKLFEEKEIILFNGDFLFTNTEFKRIANMYLSKELKSFPLLSNLKVIFKQPKHSMDYKAKFSQSQKSITLYQNTLHQNNPQEQELSLVHETFHAISYEFSPLWDSFTALTGWEETDEEYIYNGIKIPYGVLRTNPKQVTSVIKGDSFPNDYSKLGPEEMFAECATASLMLPRGNTIKAKYPQLDKYLGSKVHQFFLNSFQTLQK